MRPECSIAVIHEDAGAGRTVRYVYGQTVRDFTDTVIGALMDGRIDGDYYFTLGFAAALNAVAHDSIDFAQPLLTIAQAQAELEDVSRARRRVCDALVGFCERLCA